MLVCSILELKSNWCTSAPTGQTKEKVAVSETKSRNEGLDLTQARLAPLRNESVFEKTHYEGDDDGELPGIAPDDQ